MTQLEIHTDENKERMKDYDNRIKNRFKDDSLLHDGNKLDVHDYACLLADDEDFIAEFFRVCDNIDVKETDGNFDPDSFEHYLNIKLHVDRVGEYLEFIKVTKRLKNHQVNPIEIVNCNRMSDSTVNEVEHYDASKKALSANEIAEHVFATVDEE